MSRRFQKCIEDFTCENCGESVIGNGFTNHCPSCLWSKHVDVHPGDRAEACQGLMQPIMVETSVSKQVIIHRCVHCNARRRIRVNPKDCTTTLATISEQATRKFA